MSITRLRCFYHIACINASAESMRCWQTVVAEQLALFAHVGLKNVVTCVLGGPDDVEYVKQCAAYNNVNLLIEQTSTDLTLHEAPTLYEVWRWARTDTDIITPFIPSPSAVLYAHTKGISFPPGDIRRTRWRRIMAKRVIWDWRNNLKRLEQSDITCLIWNEDVNFPHPHGNFWMARSDWVANLPDPVRYRERYPGLNWGGGSWSNRMFTECWLGSEKGHKVDADIYNMDVTVNEGLWQFPWEVAGFNYCDFDNYISNP